jgi:ppGpp synthetase/RelA/SpoT-type nucleotidyltranferase
MTKDELIESAIEAFKEKKFEFNLFRKGIRDYFLAHPKLNEPPLPIIHSIKSRVKDYDHLKLKISRKWQDDNPISGENIFEKITDLCGVRVLHLHQAQFLEIHNAIISKINSQDWVLAEDPIAYSWDPELADFYKEINLRVAIKETYYTSIHYLVKPRRDSYICCEIQVRTLFEEIWGEISHTINYPNSTTSIACQEQLRVLARLVSTGTRLADSIFRSYEEFHKPDS